MSNTLNETLFLELGDIVKLNAPANSDINEHTFYINYIDSSDISLIDDTTFAQLNLSLTNGEINDKSIESIEILSREQNKGYARQNNLLPGKSITLQFGGDIPTTINATITDLEEDMIELKTYPKGDILYIDFAYHGIPKDLPLEYIKEFKIPDTDGTDANEVKDETTDGVTDETKDEKIEEIDIVGDFQDLGDSKIDEIPSIELDISPSSIADDDMDDMDDMDDIEFDMVVPDTAIKDRLKKMILDGDDIVLGRDLGTITEEVPVEENRQRYGIETQANDLLDEMLSTLPTNQRTSKKLNEIHLMIERFKQLRKHYSQISSQGEIVKPKIKGRDFKPLIERLKDFNKKLYWLMPIVKNQKKLYNIDDDDIDDDDIISVTLDGTQELLNEFIEQYKENRIPDGLNKYKYLNKEINKLYTPFGLPTDKSNVITETKVHDNINMVVDNLGDFYSSISKQENIIGKKRFLTQNYNVGLTELYINKNENKSGYNPERIELTPNDKAAVIGIMSLNKQALKYSHVDLPNSSILLKSHLAMVSFNYWSIFKKNRKIVNIDVDLDTEIQHEENLFLDDITAFMFKEQTKFADRSEDAFRLFLEKVIPRTNTLFDLVKKHIKNTTSYLKLVEVLEPFLIYPDDITFKQYENILEFLREQISSFKQNLVSSEIEYNTFIANDFPNKKNNNLVEILDFSDIGFNSRDQKITQSVDKYNMSNLNTTEAVRKMITSDCGRLYYSMISDLDLNLFQPIDIDKLIQEEIDKPDNVSSPVLDENCIQYTMSKHYIDIEELRNDDGKTIYFDKKFDQTRYDIIEEFKTQQSQMVPNDFRIFLVDHLIKNVGMTQEQSEKETKSILEQKREVTEGDYAYLLDDNFQPLYFYRNNNAWVKNDLFSGKNLNEIMFCNLKQSCINIKKKCGPIEINKKKIQKDLYKEILSQFDEKFHSSMNDLRRTIIETYEYNYENISRLKMLNNRLKLKNQTKKQLIANTLEERDIKHSPYENLRNLILSQQDFVKKQKDIISFCDKYTRTSLSDNVSENEYWFYCIDSSVPLIPSFYKRLANAFYVGEYEQVLEKIKTERGKLSDDGDKVVDRFSGFIISRIDYDESEGYDEQGFKIVSRNVLESNIEKIVSELDFKIPDSAKSKNTRSIINVVNTLDKNLGISVESQYEFIINLVNNILNKYIPSQKNYEKALMVAKKKKKRKRMPSYEEAYNTGLIMTTLSAYIIIIQTMMPSIRTKKTFPTCVRSFKGYPLNGDDDTSGLRYVVCAAINIARGSDAVPWNTLPKIRKKVGAAKTIDTFVSKMKSYMDSKILTNGDVKKKISDKLYYLSHTVEKEEIPTDFDVKNWNTFLPPLKPIKVIRLHDVDPSFKNDLTRMLETGNTAQFQKLSELKSKIFYFSLHIQELIQRVVNKKNISLFTLTNEPFVENACCNDGSKHTLQYFINVEPNITNFNKIVSEQSTILNNAHNLIVSPFIFDAKDTRLVFPIISKEFSEKTIYKAFLKYCKFNSGITISDDLKFICGENKSNFKNTDTVESKIKMMKHEGKIYSKSSFYQLLNIINTENIVSMDFNPVILTSRLKIEHLISNSILKEKVKDTSLDTTINILKELFDSYEATREENDIGIKETHEYLDSQLDALMNYNIIPFLSKYGIDDEYLSFIRNIEKFKTRGDDIYISRDDETAFAEYEFLKQSIHDILKIYPSIIINKVDYKSISVPKHWGVAPNHKNDIIHFIEKEFIPLQGFYDDPAITSLLQKVMDKSDSILEIMNSTPFYANIKQYPGEKRFNTLLNGKLLEKFMKYYFLYSINIYIECLNEEQSKLQDMVNGEPQAVLSSEVAESIALGKSEDVKERVVKLIVSYMDLVISNKKILNFSDIEVNEAVVKAAEREKSKIVENLGKLSQEELQVEDILKNQKLGKWGLGLSKAIYEYDKDQYEKERVEFEEEARQVLQLNQMTSRQEGGIDTDTTVLMDMLNEGAQQQRNIDESNALMRHLGDDDDFGDMDGDERF